MGKQIQAEQTDDVSACAVGSHDMEMYVDAAKKLSQFRAPTLLHTGNPHERLYVASFDGTGNDKFNDPMHATNVAKISEQIEAIQQGGSRQIVSGYAIGPGTQTQRIVRTIDGALGYTHEVRVEKMYRRFIEQAQKWRLEDPLVDIRLADVGFSRGAEEAATFARVVDERGIQDPRGAAYTLDAHGNITHVEYTKPPLMEPGQVAQVVGLFDPVGTGDPVAKYDRRLPPSVISGVQIISKDEHRGLFKSDHIIDPGLSADGRFLGFYVPGAHSDVGGGYLLNGLSTRSGNLMIDYLNALSDHPYLSKSPEPSDPGMNVVHRSTEGMLLYRVWGKIDRLQPDGYNSLEAPRHPRHGERVIGDPYNAAPRDEALAGGFDFRTVAVGPVPSDRVPATAIPADQAGTPASPSQAAAKRADVVRHTSNASIDDMVERLYQAAISRDHRSMDAVANDYLQSAEGSAWWQDIQKAGLAMQEPHALAAAPTDPSRYVPAMAMAR